MPVVMIITKKEISFTSIVGAGALDGCVHILRGTTQLKKYVTTSTTASPSGGAAIEARAVPA
jgi:hypothetical protein